MEKENSKRGGGNGGWGWREKQQRKGFRRKEASKNAQKGGKKLKMIEGKVGTARERKKRLRPATRTWGKKRALSAVKEGGA